MSKFGEAYDSDIPPGHRAQERRSMHSEDTMLRWYGFVIVRRPKDQPPIWRDKAGVLWSQHDAVEYCHEEQVKAKEKCAGS